MELLSIMALKFIGENLLNYAASKGLDKVFSDDKTFVDELYQVVLKAIEEYDSQFEIKDSGDKYGFYKSAELVEEFVKFRFFGSSEFDEYKLQNILLKNPNVIPPRKAELSQFIEIFDRHVSNNDYLRELEIEAFHKEAIFTILDRTERTLNLLENQLKDILPLITENYRTQINSCYDDIQRLHPKTALKRISELESGMQKDSDYVSKELEANLSFIKGVSHEAIGQSKEAFTSYVKAYKLQKSNKRYLNKACIAYYFLEDEQYKGLMALIKEDDDYNPIFHAIEAFEASDLVSHLINNTPTPLFRDDYFRRLIYNHNNKERKAGFRELLTALKVEFEIPQLPVSISYENLHHWFFILNSFTNRYFDRNNIPLIEFVTRNESSLQFLGLMQLLSDKLIDSEVLEFYKPLPFLRYWLESELDCQSDTITKLTFYYENMDNDDKGSFKTMLCANSIQKHGNVEKALQIINSFQGEVGEDLNTLKVFCSLQTTLSKESYKEFMENLSSVDDINIQNICSLTNAYYKSGLFERSEMVEIISELHFKNEFHRELLNALIDSFFKSEEFELMTTDEIKNIDNKVTSSEPLLKFYIALLYFENYHYDDCHAYLELYVNEEKESRDLYLYILNLHARETASLELIRLLRKWRKEFSFNPVLLRLELQQRQILREWNEILEITNYALSEIPLSEFFFTANLIALGFTGNADILREKAESVVGFDFQSTENAITVAKILVQNGFYKEGLDLIYEKALDPSDTEARMTFLSLSIASDNEKYFTRPERITSGCFVKIKIDGKEVIIQIGDKGLSTQLNDGLIDKKQGDTILIQKHFTNEFQTVEVIDIMDKYSRLAIEIYDQAQSSHSNLPLQFFKVNSNSIEELNKSIIENFAVREEQRRKDTQENFADYYNFKLAFTEITTRVFDGSYIDCFSSTTSSFGKGFLVLPKKLVKANSLKKRTIIDLSSGLLLFELSKRLQITFEELTVSKSLIGLIEEQIGKTESKRESKMTLYIYSDRVIPHELDDAVYDNRVKYLTELRSWFIENTIQETPVDKLDLKKLYREKTVSGTMDYIIENTLIARKEGSFLVTDDFTYTKYNMIESFVTTEYYLMNKFPEMKKKILAEMLTLRYLGITLDSDDVYDSFINQNKVGLEHIYTYAVRNLTNVNNLDFSTIQTTLEFLKRIALNPIVTKEKYEREATNVLSMLVINSPNPSFNYEISQQISKRFELLGEFLNITLNSLLNALKIAKMSK